MCLLTLILHVCVCGQWKRRICGGWTSSTDYVFVRCWASLVKSSSCSVSPVVTSRRELGCRLMWIPCFDSTDCAGLAMSPAWTPHEHLSRCCLASSLQLDHTTDPGSGGATSSALISLLSVPLTRFGMTQLGIARSGVYWLAASVLPRPRRGVSTVTAEGPSVGAEIWSGMRGSALPLAIITFGDGRPRSKVCVCLHFHTLWKY